MRSVAVTRSRTHIYTYVLGHKEYLFSGPYTWLQVTKWLSLFDLSPAVLDKSKNTYIYRNTYIHMFVFSYLFWSKESSAFFYLV